MISPSVVELIRTGYLVTFQKIKKRHELNETRYISVSYSILKSTNYYSKIDNILQCSILIGTLENGLTVGNISSFSYFVGHYQVKFSHNSFWNVSPPNIHPLYIWIMIIIVWTFKLYWRPYVILARCSIKKANNTLFLKLVNYV